MDSITKRKSRMEEINQDGRFRAELLLQVWQKFVLVLSFRGDLTVGIRVCVCVCCFCVCVCACVRARATVCVTFAQRQLQLL